MPRVAGAAQGQLQIKNSLS